MAKYLNRVIQLDFPELAGLEDPDDPNSRPVIWLTIRNPKLVPGGELVGKGRGVRREADGSIAISAEGMEEAYAGYAKLIIAGCVLDPDDENDDAAPLPMPPSPAVLNRYPIEVLNRLGQAVADAAPR